MCSIASSVFDLLVSMQCTVAHRRISRGPSTCERNNCGMSGSANKPPCDRLHMYSTCYYLHGLLYATNIELLWLFSIFVLQVDLRTLDKDTLELSNPLGHSQTALQCVTVEPVIRTTFILRPPVHLTTLEISNT